MLWLNSLKIVGNCVEVQTRSFSLRTSPILLLVFFITLIEIALELVQNASAQIEITLNLVVIEPHVV